MRNEKKELSYEIPDLVELVKESFHRILKENPAEWNLNRTNTQKQQQVRAKLRKALKDSSNGDNGAKVFLKEYIMDLLQKEGIAELDCMDHIIMFKEPRKLSAQDKFEILLYIREKLDGEKAFAKLAAAYKWDEPRYGAENPVYEVVKQDIEDAFYLEYRELSYEEKLSVITQRIYQLYKGHGVVDKLLDMALDGVSAGLSSDVRSIWVFLSGKTIHLPFLAFESDREMIRVCKNIYRYDPPYHLSVRRGYVANDRMDGSRVVVMRPPFSETWAFFIRKFNRMRNRSLQELLTDAKSEIPISLMEWIIKGCQVAGITGGQGNGKTSLLMSLVQFIPPAYTLRVQELTFELHLRQIYPDRNILTLRETNTITGQEGLDILKKTDGMVTILGEVATASVANWLVEISMVASLFTLFTHHAKRTIDLVSYLRNALLKTGGFTSEETAAEQVISAIRFDIHMEKDGNGHRYIERITEIVPTGFGTFEAVDLVVMKGGRYQKVNAISKATQKDILKHLALEDRIAFLAEMEQEETYVS